MQLSTSQLVVGGVLAIIWAVLGYRLSENDRKALGRTPWGLPSALWAFFWFLFLPLGLILYLIAHSTGVRQAQQHPPLPGSPMAAPPPGVSTRGSASASELFPAYPRPANSQPAAGPVGPDQTEQPAAAPSAAAPDPGGQDGGPAGWPSSPPAWHPDPSGRFHFRWWDGREWTSQVSSDGQHLIDTNPDQRIGPY